jgi:hypothetical protein
MGTEIVRVPPGFEHPKDRDGDYIPGMHYAVLHGMPDQALSGFQIYENVTEGTPISPVFPTEAALEQWLVSQGHSLEAARKFIQWGHAPSLVINTDKGAVDGIEGLRYAKDDGPD